jgi:hypothetical protein
VLGKSLESSRVQVAERAPEPTPAPRADSAAAPPSVTEQPTVDARQAPAKSARSASARSRGQDDGFAAPPPDWKSARAGASREKPKPPYAPAPVVSGAARAPQDEPEREPPLVHDKAPGAANATRATPLVSELAKNEEADALDGLAAPAPRAAPAPYATRSSTGEARPQSASRPQEQRSDTTISQALRDLERRAREHFVARRWQLAAASYRELLRHYPDDAHTTVWKKQLAVAVRALGEGQRRSGDAPRREQ